ncbi:hypothetical protein PISL3812_02556 [Talaromyces islandicus]|uniref:Uncharacterized protein n=1 Tax=Talaromyces islandicus TaxID=28573 RepID=A0A0U1LQ75_TALIS|nr:hypothetical protein PISL3812_02556 [Talaromyces islandicus]
MGQPTIFREFSEKVQAILASPDPQTILDALRALAEGRPAKLRDGTEIGALQGLGDGVQRQDPTGSYTQAITALLLWALKKFPNQSRWTDEPDLWETMALLDGPKGLISGILIGDGLYLGGVHVTRCDPPESGLFAPTVPVPTVISLPFQRQPVQPLDDDLSYIPDFLCGNSTARAVLATRCRFGWQRSSVYCLCLFVDADDTTFLENSITSLTEVVIIQHTKLRHAADNLSEAQKLLEPEGMSGSEIIKRRYNLRKNYVSRPAVDKRHPEDTETLVKQWKEACGYAEYGHIGETQEGWRSDFALIHLDDHWLRENGQWYNDDLSLLYNVTTEKIDLPGERGIVGSVDPQAGDIVYKDGASTAGTTGKIGLSEVVLFEPGTANIAKDETAPDIVRARLLLVGPLLGQKIICAPGDSGAGVFVPVSPAPEEDGWKWAGQLVSKMDVTGKRPGKDGETEIFDSLGLVIPQSQVFQSLKENTGMEWRMSG